MFRKTDGSRRQGGPRPSQDARVGQTGVDMKWGTKVKTTELAIEKNLFKKHRTGICVGIGKYYIVVVCDGQVTPSKYSSIFWRAARKGVSNE